MNNRPLILRTLITVVVVLVFAGAIHPLFQRDYYETFLGMLTNKDDAEAVELVETARELQKKNPQLYQSQALLQAADDKGIDLTRRVKGNDLQDNRDVMSLIRKQASSSIRLGLDLNGGVEFILQLVPDQEFLSKLKEDSGTGGEGRADLEKRMRAEFDRYREQAIETLRKRLETQNIFESEITPYGSRSVSLKAPIVSRDEKDKLLKLIRMSCKLSFRLVHPQSEELLKNYDPADSAAFLPPPGYEVLSASGGDRGYHYLIAKRTEKDGRSVARA